MPRKRAAPAEPVSSPRARVTRRSTTTNAPSSKRRRSPDPESESESDEEFDEEPSTSQPKKKKKPNQGATRGRGSAKSKKAQAKAEIDEDEEEEAAAPGATSRESTVETETPAKKGSKAAAAAAQSKKKKKKKPSPMTSPSTASSRSPSPAPKPEPSSSKRGRKPNTVVRGRKTEKEPAKGNTRNPPPRRKKEVQKEEEEVESPEQKKLRIRAERKARRIEAAKTRPKLTLEEKLIKLKKKKERKERRREREKEESMRQKYGQRKIKAEASKWNFGPISSINQRRRDEMMEFFPRADFSLDRNGKPKVMHNFRKATVKYNMEVLNPFITCGICNGYIVDATTIIDCMHTFCKSCLLIHFDSNNNSCPTCGTFIHGSHPTHYVTYDRAVNELVNQFVPNLEKTEMEARKRFLRDCREAIGIDTAAEDRERKERLERERVTGHNRCYPMERPRFSHHRDDCQVSIQLLPGSPNLPLISRPFIRCSEMTTMNTLKKMISLQIWDDQSRYADLDMFCDGQLMGKDFSIRFVWMMKRRGQPKSEPLIIRYQMTRTD